MGEDACRGSPVRRLARWKFTAQNRARPWSHAARKGRRAAGQIYWVLFSMCRKAPPR